MPNNIIICSVPYVDTVEPIMAPAVLKASLANDGIQSTTIDLNIIVINKISNHPNKRKILDFFFSQTIHPEVVDDLADIIDFCSDELIKHRPKIIAMSLLIYSCQIFTRWLCASIRQKHKCQIVIGGTGTKNFIADHRNNFCQQMKELGLVDDFISGDGEISLTQYCLGNKEYPGINTEDWIPIPNLNSLPYPDYSDYQFSHYQKVTIPLCDTRGCVQDCEFCDVIKHWKKFQYRSADNIFAEMLHQYKIHGITNFDFRSSLSNGNTKEFKKLLDLISEYNQDKPVDLQFSWNGYFIIRSSKQHPESLWPKLQSSNARLLIGVESVIPHIRHQMGKHFNNEDIDYHLEMSQKYQVPIALLMIVGYPTENLADYEFTKQWFRDRKKFANNNVHFVNLSFASILPGTELEKNSNDAGIKRGKLPSIWINQNLNISNQQRKQYLRDLDIICREECGFNTGTNEETLEHTNDDIC